MSELGISNTLVSMNLQCETSLSENNLALSQTLQMFCTEAFRPSMLIGASAANLCGSLFGFKAFSLCSKLFGTSSFATKALTFSARVIGEGTMFHIAPELLATRSLQTANLFGGSASSTLMVAFSQGAGKLGGGFIVQQMFQDVAVLCSQDLSASLGFSEVQTGGIYTRLLYAQMSSCQMMVGAGVTRMTCHEITMMNAQISLSESLGKAPTRSEIPQGWLHSIRTTLQGAFSPRSANEMPIEAAFQQANEQQARQQKRKNIFMMTAGDEGNGGLISAAEFMLAGEGDGLVSARELGIKEAPEPSNTQGDNTSPPVPKVESDSPTQAPQIMIRTQFEANPFQIPVLLDRGAGVTTLGSWRTTRRVAMGDADAIAYMAEDARLVRYAGEESGQSQWRDSSTGDLLSLGQIETRWGGFLREKSGIRTLERLPTRDPSRDLAIQLAENPNIDLAEHLLLQAIRRATAGSSERNQLVEKLEGIQHYKNDLQTKLEGLRKHPIDSMAADFGGIIPDYMEGKLYDQLGLTPSAVKGTRLGGAHYKNILQSASRQTQLYLYSAMQVLGQVSGFESGQARHSLPELYPHSRKVGFGFASCFEAWEKLIGMYLDHTSHKNYAGLETPLAHLLLSQPPAVLSNMLGPEFNYRSSKALLDGIVPPNMNPLIGPNVMGPVFTESAACASAFYALAVVAGKLTQRLPGQWYPELAILGAADSSLSPLWAPMLIRGFSEKAPISRARLRELGITPAQASMPLSDLASGLVISEGGGSIAVTTLAEAVHRRQFISALVAGWGVSLGEGGKEQLMGMDEGSVAAVSEAINMGIAGHGMSLKDISLVQLHGTSTKLNNIAELLSLYKAFSAIAKHYGMEKGRPRLNALKGLIGHAMGSASMLDILMAVDTLVEQRAPGLFNFKKESMDRRYSDPKESPYDLTEAFEFPEKPIEGGIEATLGVSQGFGSRNAALLLRRFDPRETLLRYSWPPHLLKQVRYFMDGWEETVGQYEEQQRNLRQGKATPTDLLLRSAYANPLAKVTAGEVIAETPSVLFSPEVQKAVTQVQERMDALDLAVELGQGTHPLNHRVIVRNLKNGVDTLQLGAAGLPIFAQYLGKRDFGNCEFELHLDGHFSRNDGSRTSQLEANLHLEGSVMFHSGEIGSTRPVGTMTWRPYREQIPAHLTTPGAISIRSDLAGKDFSKPGEVRHQNHVQQLWIPFNIRSATETHAYALAVLAEIQKAGLSLTAANDPLRKIREEERRTKIRRATYHFGVLPNSGEPLMLLAEQNHPSQNFISVSIVNRKGEVFATSHLFFGKNV